MSESLGHVNAKRELFVKEFLIDLNATQAAIRAGYSKRTARAQGCRLLIDADIQQKLKAAMEARSKRTDITTDYVLSTIHEVVERCMQREPILDKQGNPLMIVTPAGELAAAYTFNSKSALQGCELLGRHMALWRDRIEHTGKDGADLPAMDMYEVARRAILVLQEASQVRH